MHANCSERKSHTATLAQLGGAPLGVGLERLPVEPRLEEKKLAGTQLDVPSWAMVHLKGHHLEEKRPPHMPTPVGNEHMSEDHSGESRVRAARGGEQLPSEQYQERKQPSYLEEPKKQAE